MLSKWSIVGVSLAAVLCSAAAAAPKSVPQGPLRQGPARSLPHTRVPLFTFPNITQIPKCYLVAGLRTDRSGTIFTDTRGKAIARTDRMTGKIVWFDQSTRSR